MSSSPWLAAGLILASMVVIFAASAALDSVRARRRRKRLLGSGKRTHWRTRLAVALVAGAVASLAFAFAQVQVDRQVTSGTAVLALDVSHSMGNTDVLPDRLDAAQVAASRFLDRLPAGFRVGLVTFSDRSDVAIAPTAHRDDVGSTLAGLTVNELSGTVIGDGLSSALDVIEDDRAANGDRPAAVVLLSDGQDSGSTITPTQAADRARAMAVPVFTVAITGSAEEAGGATGADGSELLSQLAKQTGGRSYTSGTADELNQVYDQLGSRLSYDLAIDNGAGPFVIAGVILVLAAAALALIGPRDPYDALARSPARPRKRPATAR
jgi:Ca-activated chloride channel family protein